ncbi:Acetyltransferase [Hyella patelloides LEGE 07179]|uniref:Acetyltransferase n=1 Tax=Hyella patelloides LEGE 07179 TaxID=945734 RepID=A0A563VYS7_9CYAN|nr:GNAT family N-acetyltransferase [Hyella patelloides]VEP16555.1 Acetyltransferase [Hyella patelloides LEGE 07179]
MIREYEEQDLDDLLSVWMTASEIAHPFLTKEFLALERENIPKMYLPIAETWIAEADGCVVGFISLLGNEVGAIFVHPQHHKKGFGSGLMNKAKELRNELYVEVFAANEIARRFYEKYGFEPIEEKVHEQTGFAIIRLQLPAKKSFSERSSQ